MHCAAVLVYAWSDYFSFMSLACLVRSGSSMALAAGGGAVGLAEAALAVPPGTVRTRESWKPPSGAAVSQWVQHFELRQCANISPRREMLAYQRAQKPVLKTF